MTSYVRYHGGGVPGRGYSPVEKVLVKRVYAETDLKASLTNNSSDSERQATIIEMAFLTTDSYTSLTSMELQLLNLMFCVHCLIALLNLLYYLQNIDFSMRYWFPHMRIMHTTIINYVY